MSFTLVATAGAANANSYLTVEEAQNYFDSRIPGAIATAWDNTDSQEAALATATRVLDLMFLGRRVRVDGDPGYYRVGPAWTGVAASTTQKLAWPRLGMFDRNNYPISELVIPSELKDAVAELAGQLALSDRTLDSDTAVQGITDVSAGSVSVSFKDSAVTTKIMPDIVWSLLVPSWFTEEIMMPALGGNLLFEVL